jgi:dipeptidyl aminopeptidase/acylaminoacyl peptidase
MWIFILVLVLILLFSGLVTRVSVRKPVFLRGPALDHLSFREVSFPNRDQDLVLGGLLFLPSEPHEVPAVVVIHGSGTSKRDNSWYLALSSYLQDHGVAVLLPDKRGSERSDGDWRTAGFAELATDAIAAVKFLEAYEGVTFSEYGVIGMSQGGQIALIAAATSEQIGFVISLSGSAVPLRSQLIYEENHNLRELGVPPLLSNVLAYPAAFSILYARQREFWSTIGNPDAVPYWQELEVPALILYGSQDTNVPVRRSVKRLRSLNKANLYIKVYEDSGHAIEDPPGRGDWVIREEVLEDIREFIRRVR